MSQTMPKFDWKPPKRIVSDRTVIEGNIIFCIVSRINKLAQKSTGFQKTQNLIEETRAEIDELTQKKVKIDKVKELKEQISWCKDANDN